MTTVTTVPVPTPDTPDVFTDLDWSPIGATLYYGDIRCPGAHVIGLTAAPDDVRYVGPVMNMLMFGLATGDATTVRDALGCAARYGVSVITEPSATAGTFENVRSVN